MILLNDLDTATLGGSIGGTLFSIVAVGLPHIAETALLAFVGATVSFIASYLLKHMLAAQQEHKE
jgi:hypothetical protein